ncbi:hypothetical protein GCM10010350_37220 [Streptomyces galilaeus]|nr:hypothetical protein GCM10010350_37220 [Streptomyces galilaeus]
MNTTVRAPVPRPRAAGATPGKRWGPSRSLGRDMQIFPGSHPRPDLSAAVSDMRSKGTHFLRSCAFQQCVGRMNGTGEKRNRSVFLRRGLFSEGDRINTAGNRAVVQTLTGE